MKLELLPDFAKPYKTKGHDVRKVRGRYQLFKINSQRIEGKKYPVLKQEYLGTIDPEKGLIPKNSLKVVTAGNVLVEYGLSHFILKHFIRELVRSTFNNSCSDSVLIMAVIHFIYRHVDERFIRLSYLARKYKASPENYSESSINRAIRLSKKISECMSAMFPERSDRDYVIALLKEIRVSAEIDTVSFTYPNELVEIFKKYGIKYE